MAKDLKEELKKVMKTRGVKVPALSEQTGIPKDRIYAWYRDGSKPKADDATALQLWINGENSNFKQPTGGDPVDQILHQKGPYAIEQPDLIKAIMALAENNQALIGVNKTAMDNTKTALETNRIIANTNSALAEKLTKESVIDKSDLRTIEETVAMVKGMKAYIADLAHNLTKAPAHEILQVINSKVKDEMKKADKRGIRSDGHK